MLKIPSLLIALLLFVTSSKAQDEIAKPFNRGAGQFDYSAYHPLKDKPVTIFYYIPTKGDVSKMKILISMHGAERSGMIQRGVWRNLAEKHGFIVIAPQFTHENGYQENDYQFGGVSKTKKKFDLKPEEEWTYKIIESLFDYTKKLTGNKSKNYDMFGHSAGGQFVHRYLLMTPEARVNKAIAANPGNYTYPIDTKTYNLNTTEIETADWPYSLHNTPFASKKRLAAYFKRDLVIAIGTADTASTKTIDKSPLANLVNLQGNNRYERAQNYFNFCKALAKQNELKFNWTLFEVPNAGHSSTQIVHGNPSIKPNKIENDELVYATKELKEAGAFHLLFRK